MTVAELIDQLQHCNPEAEVYYTSYEIEDDYDWDENLELRYIPAEVIVQSVEANDDTVLLF